MSEAGEGVTSTEGVTAGTLLRQAREAAGLHIANLAANLKVPVRKLEALEADNYEQLGDAVFVRALASSVCRTLKADPQPVLARLPQTAQPRLAQDSEGINAPFHSPQDGPGPGMLEQVSKPVVLTVIALLLGALVLVFLPLVQRGFDTVREVAASDNNKPDPVMPPPGAAANVPTAPVPVEAASATAPNPFPAAVSPAANPVAIAAAAPEAVAAASAARAPASAPAAAASTPRPVASAAVVAAAPAPAAAPVVPPAATPASAPALPASAASAAQAAANGVVVFRTKGPSWIRVTDARGTTVLQRLMNAGESAGASGTLPLSVTVGDVGKTEVQVRGQPYNLAPVSRDNVARFQVN